MEGNSGRFLFGFDLHCLTFCSLVVFIFLNTDSLSFSEEAVSDVSVYNIFFFTFFLFSYYDDGSLSVSYLRFLGSLIVPKRSSP